LIEADTPDSMRLTLPSGSVVADRLNGYRSHFVDGDLEFSLESIATVGVEDLRWVEQHAISRVYNSISHFIRFVGGGEVRFAFSLDGDLLELSCTGAAMIIRDGNRLFFGPPHQGNNA
jgi:hypothetical protein